MNIIKDLLIRFLGIIFFYFVVLTLVSSPDITYDIMYDISYVLLGIWICHVCSFVPKVVHVHSLLKDNKAMKTSLFIRGNMVSKDSFYIGKTTLLKENNLLLSKYPEGLFVNKFIKKGSILFEIYLNEKINAWKGKINDKGFNFEILNYPETLSVGKLKELNVQYMKDAPNVIFVNSLSTEKMYLVAVCDLEPNEELFRCYTMENWVRNHLPHMYYNDQVSLNVLNRYKISLLS